MPQLKHPPAQNSYVASSAIQPQFESIHHNYDLPHTRTRTIIEDENGDFFLVDDSGQLHCLTGAPHAPSTALKPIFPASSRPALSKTSPKSHTFRTSGSDTSRSHEDRTPTSPYDLIPPVDDAADSEPDSGFTVVASPHSYSEAKEFEGSDFGASGRNVTPDSSYPLRRREISVKKSGLDRQFQELQFAGKALKQEDQELQQCSYQSTLISKDTNPLPTADDKIMELAYTWEDGGYYESEESLSSISQGSGSYGGLQDVGKELGIADHEKATDSPKPSNGLLRSTATICADGVVPAPEPDQRPLTSSQSTPPNQYHGGQINAGYLYIISKIRRWKKQEFRCNDRFLVCLRDEYIVPDVNESFPFLGTVRKFDITVHSTLNYTQDGLKLFPEFQVTVPTLNHALFATPSNRTPYTVRYYQKPKYVVRLSDVHRITLIARHGKVLERCFVVHTSDRKYILRAETDEEMKQWLLLLVQRTRSNTGERERNEMDDILASIGDIDRPRQKETDAVERDLHLGTAGIEVIRSNPAVGVPVLFDLSRQVTTNRQTLTEDSSRPEIHRIVRIGDGADNDPDTSEQHRVPSAQLVRSPEPRLVPTPTLQYAKPDPVSSKSTIRSICLETQIPTDLQTLTATYRTQILSRSYFLLNELGCASGFIPVLPASSSWDAALSEANIPVLVALQHLSEVVREFEDHLSSCREADARRLEVMVDDASVNMSNKIRFVVGEGGLLADPRSRMEARESVEVLIDVFRVVE